MHVFDVLFLLGFWDTAPVHQVQQYYRLGVLDNCSGKWTALVDCLTLKTKRSTEVQVGCFLLPFIYIYNGCVFTILLVSTLLDFQVNS